MSEQVVDLRSTWAILRRRRRLLAVAAILGAVVGVGLLLLSPPRYSSTSSVLLPGTTTAGGESSTTYDAETQVLLAGSAEVLRRAGSEQTPPLSAGQVESRTEITAPAASVVRFTAQGRSPNAAKQLSAALADAHVAYLEETANALTQQRRQDLEERQTTLEQSLAALNDQLKKSSDRLAAEDKASPAGRADAAAIAELTAQRANTVLELDDIDKQLQGSGTSGGDPTAGAARVIQHSSSAERSDLVQRLVLFVSGGATLALLLAVAALVLRTRREAELRSRDEIANAVGIPVLASFRSRGARSASGWVDLLHSYAPDNVDGWAMRQLLRSIMSRPVDVSPDDNRTPQRRVIMLSLANDAPALAAAPQLAAFAASTGASTTLVAMQMHESASALWAACVRTPDQASVRHGLTLTTHPDASVDADLTVAMAVLDGEDPQPPAGGGEGTLTLLAVSAGAATASTLADVMVAADAGGGYVEGLVVVDPDPLDRTTGQLGPRERLGPAAPPARLASLATEGSGGPTTRRIDGGFRTRSRK